MIDLHCHILPGLDDGAQNLQQALDMASLLHELGYTKVVATPHMPGYGMTPLQRTDVFETLEVLKQAMEQHHIPLTVVPGAEHSLEPVLLALGQEAIIPLGGDESNCLLVEFPWQNMGPPEELLQHLLDQGYALLLAHPERSRSCDLVWLESVANSALVFVQAELGSFAGAYGQNTQLRFNEMCERGLIHAVGSDMHGLDNAKIVYESAFAALVERFGSHAKAVWCQQNPQALLDNDFDGVRSIL